jgi:hypothetical protein
LLPATAALRRFFFLRVAAGNVTRWLKSAQFLKFFHLIGSTMATQLVCSCAFMTHYTIILMTAALSVAAKTAGVLAMTWR